MRVAQPGFSSQLRDLIGAEAGAPRGLLACGLRRSYGDSALNDDGALIDMTELDHFIRFDRERGVIEAEAGASLADVLKVTVPAGWFLPVTPGTKFVTLGGAIANDVHGKNHHRAGTFGHWVLGFTLLRSDGNEIDVLRDHPCGMFAATVGGLGLTGVITKVTLQLSRIASSNMAVQTIPFGHLRDFFELSKESDASHDYTVAWVDCLARGNRLGRGIFSRARQADDGILQLAENRGPSVPVDAPSFVLNRFSIAAFNETYYRLAARPKQATVSYGPFFYPLDAIGHWNKLYGRRGFYQYQSVVPPAAAEAATAEMLSTIAAAGEGSFLAVLKTFGTMSSPGLLSFPMPGTTLALDFANRGASTLALLDRLDRIVREAGGRLYPAKDGRLSPTMFRTGYPALEQFKTFIDPGMSSTFWRRMAA